MRKFYLVFVPLIFLILAASGGSTANLNVSISEIATTDTVMPSGASLFRFFGVPILDGDTVVFLGAGESSPTDQGIFRFSSIGGLDVVVDTDTVIPGSSSTFSSFGQEPPSSSAGNIAFWGCCDELGVFRHSMGSLTTIIDRTTPIPNMPIPSFVVNFDNFIDPVADGPKVAFAGGSFRFDAGGIYMGDGGPLTVIVEQGDAMPGSGGKPFVGFNELNIDDGQLVFKGSSHFSFGGVYHYDGASVKRVVDVNDIVPGTTVRFIRFEDPVIDDGNIVYWGTGAASTAGIFLDRSGIVEIIADRNTPIPDSTGNFKGVGQHPQMDGDAIVFLGRNESNETGIYLSKSGELYRLISADEPLGSSTLARIDLLGNLEGQIFCFSATLTNDDKGIYCVEFSEPTPIDIELKAKNDNPNIVQVGKNTLLSVTAWTTSEFDATQIDAGTLAFGPSEAGIFHSDAHIEDIDQDGDADLTAHFRTTETGIACGDKEASLTGETFNGDAFIGSTTIVTVGTKNCPRASSNPVQ